MSNRAVPLGVCVAALLAVSPACAWPPDFVVQPVASGWNQAVGMTFIPSDPPGGPSRMLVWEKAGRVWIVEQGQRLPQPLLDISEEVGNWRDFGMLGLAVDPQFHVNGRIYVLYAVDYHHLAHFGTAEYDPSANEYFRDTIGRLTRYTCDPATGRTTVVPGSRRVLVGESISTGFPLCHQSHGIGSLVFGEDGTLLASCGDGASYEVVDTGGPVGGSSNTARADGIIRASEDVGAFRAQLVDSLNGKVIRIDPETGDAVPSNPFYDPAAPRAARSRVWAMGFRNPFRMSLRPGTGAPDPSAADPGSLYVGDVGWFTWEELSVVRSGGRNFGWPIFEGFLPMTAYLDAGTLNRDARNPLFGVNGCAIEFFPFRNLLLQDTLNPNPLFPNPCNPQVQVPASVPHFLHTRPAIDWSHGGVARCGGYIGITATVYQLGATGAPVTGPQFGGACSVGGVWCSGLTYPPEFRNSYFHADFASGWIKRVVFDAEDRPVSVENIEGSAGPVVALASDPATGELYYIGYNEFGQGVVNRVRYSVNAPPDAVASATPSYGQAPLEVRFSAAGSRDPEQNPLSYEWTFGDGTPPARVPEPVHVYQDERDITAQGTFVAMVFNLNPPGPQGAGSRDPEVMRDLEYPAPASEDTKRQFDTFHGGDQGTSDWVGYTFPSTRVFTSLVFQEGRHFYDGGWFQTVRVQVRQPNGQWTSLTNAQVTPVYPGNNGVSFESFTFRFPPTSGTGIRIQGVPGGSAHFVSVGELRVFERGDGTPMRRDAVLRVTDDGGSTSSAGATVWLNDTPPSVLITSPVDGSVYNVCRGVTIPLTADVSDDEHGPDQLVCSWQTVLHHDEHTHPEPPDPACSTSTMLTPHGSGQDMFYYEIRLTVTDPLGLATTRSVTVHATCCPGDWNSNGVLDSQDFFEFLASFFSNNADFNADGATTSQDFFDYLAAFFGGC